MEMDFEVVVRILYVMLIAWGLCVTIGFMYPVLNMLHYELKDRYCRDWGYIGLGVAGAGLLIIASLFLIAGMVYILMG